MGDKLPKRTAGASTELLPLSCQDALWMQVEAYARCCSWRAGESLADAMLNNRFAPWERVFVAMADGNIAGFCTLMGKDCIPGLPYTPYVGYVFVGEQYRGARLSERLCDAASAYAAQLGYHHVYLISDHVNLYEKYGFRAIDHKPAPWGAMETIYVRPV